MKICSKCKKEKPDANFNFKKKAEGKRQSSCSECQKIMKDKHYRDNKQDYYERNKRIRKEYGEWFRKFKESLSCVECGENHPATIDFHHTDPKKKEFEVADMVNKFCGKQRILNEIKKCKVLCSNCHRKLHWNEHRSHRLTA